MKKRNILFATVMCAALTSCENGDWSFPDFEYTTVYFASQSPVRTLVLGEDYYPTDLDNEHKCKIVATMGGVYDNGQNITIDVKVDESLLSAGYQFKLEGAESAGNDIVAMPSNYYRLTSNQIVIPKGKILGGVTVELTDEFFADPKSLSYNYVIPMVMTAVTGADSILQGSVADGVSSPDRLVAADWAVVPKDYILYALKYVSPYQANYLRRGVDQFSAGKTGTVVRHKANVEKDDVVLDEFKTLGINEVEWDFSFLNKDNLNVPCPMKLSFDKDGKCSIAFSGDSVKVTGSGQYVAKADSWGGQPRDVLYLDYTIDYTGTMDAFKCATKDTLVVRDRGIKSEWFTIVKK